MKDFTQKFLCLILSLATVLSLSAPAFAADYSSAETLDGSLTSTLDYSNVKLSNSKELGVENINNELREIFPYGEIVSIIETPYGTAFYVDKNYHNPIKTRTIWDALDVVMAGASWADFFKEPSLANLGWAALDTVSLLPILPSSAYIRKGGKILLNVDEVKKLAKTPEGLEKIKKALKATDKASDILEAGRKLAKKYTLSDSVYRDHIVKLHSFYSKEKNKSKFIKNFDIKKAIKETLTDSKSIVSQNTNGRKGFIFIKNFGEKIGTEGGKSLNRMKVVIDEYGKVVTAYPIK
ncbi:hypothetical protein JQM63_10225 [Oscillibacter valericigenes]|nr:hypothetical protein [Oscillibacter valericigenes]